jgi:predicted Zn-dependent peptidase
MAKITRVKFKNGLKLIVVPREESLTTTVAVLVAAGSKYETKEINGLSHFLEHMCFKGTEKRPRPIDIASELDGMGAQYNAFTSHEYTSYYAKVRNGAFKNAFDVVSDLYLHPVFREEDIEIERGVISEEINMYEDTPRSKIGDIFMELLYGDQPAGWSIAGPKENILKFSKDDFVSYREKNYLPEATVVLISGGVSPSRAISAVREEFGILKRGKKMRKQKVVEAQKKPSEKIVTKKLEQTHLILGVRAFDMYDRRRYALSVLAEVLGGGMSSRLFKRVRDELGAAYYVGASADLLSDHGFLGISAGVDNRKVETVIGAALEELVRFKKERVGDKELEKAKEHLIGDLFLSVETSDAIGYFYGSQEIMDVKLASPHEIARRIRKVTAGDVQKVAREIITKQGLNLALIGPFKDRSFLDILKV